VRVQGPGAAADVAAGIADLNRLGDVDVLLVGRGGGSLEDLWAFNEEIVARAIAASRVPVVAGVGHEIDFTIADLVADHRAATPTAAAAAVVPEREQLRAMVSGLRDALMIALVRRIGRAEDQVRMLARRLVSPRRRVDQLALELDELQARLRRVVGQRVAWDRRELAMLTRRLGAVGPTALVARTRDRLTALQERLRLGIAARVREAERAIERAQRQLAVLSPLGCLERGYAIVRLGGNEGPIVRDAAVLQPGDGVSLVLARGRASGRIERVEPETS
jgi:exodeoxyribonuclease VII large subunit